MKKKSCKNKEKEEGKKTSKNLIGRKRKEEFISDSTNTSSEQQNLSNQIKKFDKNDFIKLTYIIKNDEYKENFQIFGEDFVENNKNNCKISINSRDYKLSSIINLNNYNIENNTISILLKGISYIRDMSSMFYNCSSLIEIDDKPWNTENVEDMNFMFFNCNLLTYLPNYISKWDTKNVKNLSGMFSHCTSLKFLPDISKWNTKKITNLSFMFYNCLNLVEIPDISKWDVKNVDNFWDMFSSCSSLKSLPEIEKWVINENAYMNAMFAGCTSLENIPIMNNKEK